MSGPAAIGRPIIRPPTRVVGFSNLFALFRCRNPFFAFHPCLHQPAGYLAAGELPTVIRKKEALPKTENADRFSSLELKNLHAVVHVTGASNEKLSVVNRERVARGNLVGGHIMSYALVGAKPPEPAGNNRGLSQPQLPMIPGGAFGRQSGEQ